MTDRKPTTMKAVTAKMPIEWIEEMDQYARDHNMSRADVHRFVTGRGLDYLRTWGMSDTRGDER